MADGERPADPPARGNGGERLEHESALGDLRMGDREPARAPIAPAPQDNVEVENARPPAATAAAAKIALDGLEAPQHPGWVEVAFDERHRIGEIAASVAVRGVEYDRRGVEQAELLIEAGDGGLDDLRRAAEAAVRPVGADGDRVKVTSSG
jgi:hypothetical protein